MFRGTGRLPYPAGPGTIESIVRFAGTSSTAYPQGTQSGPPVHLAVPENCCGLTLILAVFDRCGKGALTLSATGGARAPFPRARGRLRSTPRAALGVLLAWPGSRALSWLRAMEGARRRVSRIQAVPWTSAPHSVFAAGEGLAPPGSRKHRFKKRVGEFADCTNSPTLSLLYPAARRAVERASSYSVDVSSGAGSFFPQRGRMSLRDR